MKIFFRLKKDGKCDSSGALLSRGFTEPYVGSHRLMGRLVPGLPGILRCTPHSARTHSPPRHPPTPTPPDFPLKIPPPLSSNLTFFSGADPGRPTLFPTARQKPAL